MNTTWKIILGLAILVAIFFLGRCSKIEQDPKTITIEIPGKSGSSDTIYKPKPIFVHHDSLIYKDSIIKTENPFNKELADRYTKLENDYQKAEAYLKAIQIRKYNIPFEDNLVKIDNHIEAQGEVVLFKQDYFIKPQTITAEIPSKELKRDNFGVLLGARYLQNLDTEKGTIGIDGGIRILKVNILGTVTTNKDVGIGLIVEF